MSNFDLGYIFQPKRIGCEELLSMCIAESPMDERSLEHMFDPVAMAKIHPSSSHARCTRMPKPPGKALAGSRATHADAILKVARGTVASTGSRSFSSAHLHRSYACCLRGSVGMLTICCLDTIVTYNHHCMFLQYFPPLLAGQHAIRHTHSKRP